ncbi:winged helix-turn-helix transcriptional regulator [Streptomyces huiliensis]|uniref:winged helix-turn-helix transcriptional regulator n=1 Tax=Streptomyces huiliensis TaxID=2876027 RepID=UPI001CBC36E7|nr:helix-turn-helix domain-containing protein [Streptomyces huiliensis]MBZ4321573.1 helix-turn-helix transcriptional regulator [Streptomyces huiliensis]
MNANDLQAAHSAIGLVSKKWDLFVLASLQSGPRGHSETARLTGMDRKQLTRVLRRLEDAGLVSRRVDIRRSPIRVWYGLTAAGWQLLGLVAPFADWWQQGAEGQVCEPRRTCPA